MRHHIAKLLRRAANRLDPPDTPARIERLLDVVGFGFRDRPKLCPECVTDGLTSKVYVGSSWTTLVHWPDYYDEDGQHHPPPNQTHTSYECSRGHTWTEPPTPGTMSSTTTTSGNVTSIRVGGDPLAVGRATRLNLAKQKVARAQGALTAAQQRVRDAEQDLADAQRTLAAIQRGRESA